MINMKTITTGLFILLFLNVKIFAECTDPELSYDSSGKIAAGNLVERNNNGNIHTLGIPPQFSFDEHPVNHNMHIASDGEFYFTINGGGVSSGQVNKFDLNGTLLQTYPIQIDGRGLSYNKSDGFLYVSTFGGDIVRITDLAAATFTMVFPGVMQNGQASFAISDDGLVFYDFNQGTLRVHDFATGSVINTLTGLAYGSGNYGGEAAVAVDSSHFYTWDAVSKTVYMYDQLGTLIQPMVLDSGDNGQSLSFVNDMLFVSRDGNYNIGTWYGYDLSGLTTIPNSVLHEEIAIFPNPTKDKCLIKGDNILQVEIFNGLGESIVERKSITSHSIEINLENIRSGLYFAKITTGENIVIKKLIVE